jgi:hypothetical protein
MYLFIHIDHARKVVCSAMPNGNKTPPPSTPCYSRCANATATIPFVTSTPVTTESQTGLIWDLPAPFGHDLDAQRIAAVHK